MCGPQGLIALATTVRDHISIDYIIVSVVTKTKYITLKDVGRYI